MKLILDTATQQLTRQDNGQHQTVPLFSEEAFELLSQQWLRVGWNQKYVYTFTWLGRPVIQLPEDLIRIQEVLYRVKPDVLIETGIAHGGSLVYYASLCRAIGRGRVVGVDMALRPENRRALQSHEMSSLIRLIDGGSTDPAVVRAVREQIGADEAVFVVLDSNHTKDHVLAELNAYAELVTVGSYLVVTDGIMGQLHDVPRGQQEWARDNPAAAVQAFTAAHSEFVVEQPSWPFNESRLSQNVTHWPQAYLRRLR